MRPLAVRRLLVTALLGSAVVVGAPAAPANACHTYLHCLMGLVCVRTPDIEYCP